MTIPTTDTAASLAISHVNLFAHASANTPIPWPLEDFCGYFTQNGAGLQSFLQAKISTIRLCRAQTHEYVLLKVESTRLPYLGRCIWFRCERRPTHVPIASLAFQDPRAADTVTMSFEETKLALNMQLRSMNTHGLRFEDVVELWRIIEEQSSNYSLFSLNCWWFASVIWETLTQVFPGEAPVITHDHLLKKVIKSVGPDTAQRTEDVTRMFLAKLGINAKKTSLGSVDPSPSERRPIFRLFTRRSSKSNSLPYSPTHAPMLPPLPFETAVAQMFRAGSMPAGCSRWGLLEAMLRSDDPTDKIVFLVTYRAFASGSDVLETMKKIAEAHAGLKLRALSVAQLWSLWSDGKLRDRHVQAPVREWIHTECFGPNAHRQQLCIAAELVKFEKSINNKYPILAQPSRGLNDSTIRSISDKDRIRILGKIRSQDTDMTRRLVGALRRREIEMRERLTPRNTMEWLEWMYSPGTRDWSHPLGFGLFDTSEEVYYWVLNTILCIDFEDRMDWYRYFLRLAELCQKDKNYASMCGIMQALNYVDCLNFTRRACSRDAERNFTLLFAESNRYIEEAVKDLNTGDSLYPLDALHHDLHGSFVAASRDPNGEVSWRACQELFLKLPGIITPTSNLCPPDPTDIYALLVSEIKAGLLQRSSMAERVQKLAGDDKWQYDEWRSRYY